MEIDFKLVKKACALLSVQSAIVKAAKNLRGAGDRYKVQSQAPAGTRTTSSQR